MNCLKPFVALVLIAASASLGAQQGPPPSSPPPETSQFDFLIGQWELQATPKVNGMVALLHGTPKLVGVWKAWRGMDGFGIDDEVRLIDSSGNPAALNHSLRVYSSSAQQWLIANVDAYRGRSSQSTGIWKDRQMLITGQSTSPDGQPVLTRATFSQITADGFRVQQDRSSDNGASWDESVLVIEAKRVAASATR